MKSIKRFISLEEAFPGQFIRYVIAVNCGFWKEKKDGKNLSYLLTLAKGDIEISKSASSVLEKFIKKCAIRADQPREVVLQVMGKIVIEGDLPGIKDIEQTIVKRLSELPSLQGYTYGALQRISESYGAGVLCAASSDDEHSASMRVIGTDSQREKTV